MTVDSNDSEAISIGAANKFCRTWRKAGGNSALMNYTSEDPVLVSKMVADAKSRQKFGKLLWALETTQIMKETPWKLRWYFIENEHVERQGVCSIKFGKFDSNVRWLLQGSDETAVEETQVCGFELKEHIDQYAEIREYVDDFTSFGAIVQILHKQGLGDYGVLSTTHLNFFHVRARSKRWILKVYWDKNGGGWAMRAEEYPNMSTSEVKGTRFFCPLRS
jgi:hypothetical protein